MPSNDFVNERVSKKQRRLDKIRRREIRKALGGELLIEEALEVLESEAGMKIDDGWLFDKPRLEYIKKALEQEDRDEKQTTFDGVS